MPTLLFFCGPISIANSKTLFYLSSKLECPSESPVGLSSKHSQAGIQKRVRGMGNHRFKLSDIMPNAFYKLGDVGRKKKEITHHSHKKKQFSSSSTPQPSKPKQPHQPNPRKSYYFTRQLNPVVSDSSSHDPPRKLPEHTPSRRTTTTKSDIPPDHLLCPFDSSDESEFPEPEFRTDRILPTEAFNQTVSLPSNSRCSWRMNFKPDDIVIDVDKKSTARKDEKLNEYDSFSEFELPPITIKKKETKSRSGMSTYEEPSVYNSLKFKIVKEDKTSIKQQSTTHVRRLTVSSTGVKRRINSPRIASRKIQTQTRGRKSAPSSATNSSSSRRRISNSLAIVKSSWNPERDFRESMVEMIVKNKIRASKELEDLLACYLYLNSVEYHDIIIEVFKQIWFDLTDTIDN